MPNDDEFRYTEEHPYISNGGGRNSVKDKSYVGVDADICEFEDMYFSKPWNGGVNKMGLGLDEVCDATINLGRKNYLDLFPNGEIKAVGNTVKSRSLSGFIEKFFDKTTIMLLHKQGREFLDAYYDYVGKIYNYQIPLRDIASKGKIKKTIEEYIADCSTFTKAGSKKSRQAWYELVIKDNMKVNIDDTIYYINTGTKKSETDVKRVTHQFAIVEGEEVEITAKVRRQLLTPECEELGLEYRTLKTKQIKELLAKHVVREEDEIILNCQIVPREIVDSSEDVMCGDIEYNVVKYIDMFNSRIKPLLVCFHPDIRDSILITNPDDRPSFTDEQCELVSGFPMRETDQDTYEQLMTLERKEIEFWLNVGEKPPFIEECGMDWDKIVADYEALKLEEDNVLFAEENEKYLEILESLTEEDIIAFEEEGIIPKRLEDIVTLDSETMKFKFKLLPSMSPSTGGNIFEDLSFNEVVKSMSGEYEYESFVAAEHD